MLYHVPEPRFHGNATDYSGPDRLSRSDPAVDGDPVLAVAYAISELAIAILGPTFWILIVYLLLAEEWGLGPA